MAGWHEEALGRGPRRERGNVAAVLLDRVSNAGTTPPAALALRVAVLWLPGFVAEASQDRRGYSPAPSPRPPAKFQATPPTF